MEVNLKIPHKAYNQDILLLVIPSQPYHQRVPITLGTFTLNEIHQSFRDNGEVDTITGSWKMAYETHVIREELEQKRDLPLGQCKLTKSITLYPGGYANLQEVSAMHRIPTYGFKVNAITQPSIKAKLPEGVVPVESFTTLNPGSSRVKVCLMNME